MGFPATAYQVMIASPGDVDRERQVARDVVWQWNYMHSARSGIVLIPIGWDTHSAPATGDRPQAIINEQVLAESDLLIGIFWTRLGTPTGEADSGTVEEIQKHIAADKPVMLYFSSAPIHPESIDAHQYERLKQFKQQCQEWALIDNYESPSEFAQKLARYLVKTVLDGDYFESPVGQSEASVEVPGGPVGPEDDGLTAGLSGEAQELLLEAVQSQDGVVLRILYMGGMAVQTNGRNFVADDDARSQAVWESALDELCQHGLLADRGYKGEVFRVTRRGYETADLVKGST